MVLTGVTLTGYWPEPGQGTISWSQVRQALCWSHDVAVEAGMLTIARRAHGPTPGRLCSRQRTEPLTRSLIFAMMIFRSWPGIRACWGYLASR